MKKSRRQGHVFLNEHHEKLSPHKFKEFLKWRLTSLSQKWPNFVSDNVNPKLDHVLTSNNCAVTYINHATLLIQCFGMNILTDPVFFQRVSPVSFLGPRRRRNPGISLSSLPKIDVVLVSHNHYDHMEKESLIFLHKEHAPTFLTPLGNKKFFDSFGISNVLELDWQDSFSLKNFNFTLVPMQHWSARTLFDRNRALWGGFVIEQEKLKILFAGDTGYNGHFTNIQEKFGPMDVSLLPIGAYEPRWLMKDHHMNPEDAVKAHLDLGSKLSLGIHFGTFQLTDEGIDEPVLALHKAINDNNVLPEAFLAPKNGETVLYQKA